ncbi:indole-3-acetaldehyde oxidase isoform X2 [Ziziphus jujuba]|nr:indole-3-acetaldehyde oxidase isoform X2 [Ziziphus jujuba]
MCVSLFGALINAEKTNRSEPPPPFSKLNVSEAEKAVAGNLCRCTGYRPIADACKSLAADVDIEDLGLNSFWTKEHSKEEKISKLPVYDRNHEICTFPEFLKNEIRSGITLDSKRYNWHSPASVEELQNLLKVYEGTEIKTVVSNTGMGYYKEIKPYDKYIDLKHVPELSILKLDQTGVEIGAAVTISKVIEALKKENQHDFYPRDENVLRKIASHMEKVASGFIRNTASVGGNLVMAQRKHFPSDIATILLAVDSVVDIMSSHQFERITLEEFLLRPPLDFSSVLVNVKIPSVGKVLPETNTILLFETYRAAPRPLGSALAFLNAAFLAEVSPCETSDGILVNHCQLAFGAYGTKHAIRARRVEEFLSGKILNAEVLYEAIQLIRATVVSEDGTANPAYRSSLAAGFLFEFFSSLIDGSAEISNGFLNGYASTSMAKCSKLGQSNVQDYSNKIPTMLSSAKQVLELSKSYYPVGEPISKSGAAIQASGEAVYVDDIPSPTDCLHGAFIYSTKPLARVRSIKVNSKPHPDGVAAVISYKDIPELGENIGSNFFFGSEPLFADELTQCAGQRVAFVVADAQKHANMVANCAVVEYGMEDLEPPILSVEEAVKRSSFFDVPPFFYPQPVGDISKGMAEADHKIVSAEIKLGSQYYFYMETQTALAVPDEDNCIVVYSSIQNPEFAHSVIAKCLGIPENNVRVLTRRVGGGFGGKAVAAIPVATACALAAHKLHRPVRMYMNRKTDMIMTGGRHPMKITYTVGFKADGKITALQIEILIDAGISPDMSPLMPHTVSSALQKYDWGALSINIKVCKTNNTSKSSMRAPGDLQGSFIAEAIIEHVASTLSLEVDSVRNVNLHTYNSLKSFYRDRAGENLEYTLPLLWEKLAVSSSFDKRVEMVKEFNRCNKWKKKGISRVPIFYGVSLRPTPGRVSILKDGSIVVEVGGIEIGQGLWTKVKQMTAFGLNTILGSEDGDLLDRVRVIQADTLSLIQGGITGGSTTSESSCEAVRLCCNILVERLTPFKERMQKQMGPIKWDTLVSQAHMQSVNLSASTFYIPDASSSSYLNYGVAVSEVEVNLLTGETTVLQVDIIYDCGKSLNPAVDLGQIEGAFVQGIGFFMSEEYLTNSDGLVITDSTWSYKIPSMDTIPKQFNVELLNSSHNEKRVLSSKASGEPPLLLAVSVHCATRAAVKEARKQLLSWSGQDGSESIFQLDVPATMPVVKELCGLDIVEKYLKWSLGRKN